MRPSQLQAARARLASFVALGLAQASIYLVLATWDGYQARPSYAMILALGAFTLYLAALWSARYLSGTTALLLALIFGLLFRAMLIPRAPFLSDDVFRYIWDGLVQLRGINPYRYAPADPALAGIDDGLRQLVNHPGVHTIYPPLAQIVFAAAALTGRGWLALKAIWLVCDLGVAALLYRMVPAARRLQAWTLYWWSPLVVIEVAWNAHLDLLGVLPLVAALWWAQSAPARSTAMGLTLAAATLVKYFPAALAPAAARNGQRARLLTVFAAALMALYLPYLGAGRQLFAGLATYAESWRFNDGLFRALTWVVPSATLAKLIVATLVLALVTQSIRNRWSLERTAFWISGAILALSPTVHPWYLLWMVPLIALRFSRGWLYLSGSVFLAYYGLEAYRVAGVWPEPWWVKLLIWGPFLVLILLDAWRGSWWRAAWQALWLSGRRPRGASQRRRR